MRRYDLVTMGELLYVLKAAPGTRLEQTRSLSCHASGAEANVAIGLARLGWSTSLVTKACDNFVGRFLVSELRGHAVDTSGVVWTSDRRMGVLYQELGVTPRPSKAVHDREHSAFTTLSEHEVDWGLIRSADRLYLTGITAALGQNSRSIVRRAVNEAKGAGTKVVFDVNHRSSLWTGIQLSEFLVPLLKEVDVLYLKENEARQVLGLDADPVAMAQELRETHDIGVVVMSLGEWGALATDGTVVRVDAVEADVVNRFGLGDAFMSGFLFGSAEGDVIRGLEYGRAMAALKGTDTSENFPLATLAEIEYLVDALRNGESGPPATDVIR